MATYYFKVGSGEPFTDKTDAGEAAVAAGEAIKTDSAPDGVESWRMTYNFSTNSVDVFAEGKDEAGAQADKKAANDAEAAANKTATDERAAADKADA